jgi:hypothetical protein
MINKQFFDFKLPDKVFEIDSSLLILFLSPLVIIILFLISLNLVLFPKITEIGSVNAEIKSVEASTSKIKEQNNYLTSVDQNELQKDADYLNNAVLKNKESYLLVEVIRGVANKFDYQVGSFSLTPGDLKDSGSVKIADSKDVVKMPVSLSLVGPDDKSLDLILALEKTLPILFIDKFEKRLSGSMAQLDLTVSSYYIGDNTNMETNNVSLNDLILSKDELSLINKISSFTKIDINSSSDVGVTTAFQQYQRDNPFSL